MEQSSLLYLPLRIFFLLFVIWTFPITYFCRLFNKISKWLITHIAGFIINVLRMSVLRRVAQRVINFSIGQKISVKEQETPTVTYLTPFKKQQYIQKICHQVSQSPKKQTKNRKMLLLMQKLIKLQQNLFEQSRKRCAIQKQIFILNIKTVETQRQLINLKKQKAALSMQIVNLQNQLEQISDQINEEIQIMHLLENQKQHLQQLKGYVQKFNRNK